MYYQMATTRLGMLAIVICIGCGSAVEDTSELGLDPQSDARWTEGTAEAGLSEVTGCHFYVDSNYGGRTLWMPRGYTISSLHDYSMGDKISAVRLRGGATTRMWIDRYYRGNSWLITSDVPTLHPPIWADLGDNASSADCY